MSSRWKVIVGSDIWPPMRGRPSSTLEPTDGSREASNTRDEPFRATFKRVPGGTRNK